MLSSVQSFRQEVTSAVCAAMSQRPGCRLYLVYSPELADPLKQVDDHRRESVPIRPSLLGSEYADIAFPRLVTLDCRRVAPYLLETDAARDDPLFESSITQAHAETCLGERANLAVINDNPGPSETTVCGWIVSRQSAQELARRMANHSHPLRADGYHRWLRWHNPIYLTPLWLALSPIQQRALLGDALWIAHDVAGNLRSYESDMTGVTADEVHVTFRPNDEQWQRYDDAPAAAQLLRSWHAQCLDEGGQLPSDAVERLFKHLSEARRQRLRGDDRTIYALTLARLPDESVRAPEWAALLGRVSRREITLRDGLSGLPDHFWNPPAAGIGSRPAGKPTSVSTKEVTT